MSNDECLMMKKRFEPQRHRDHRGIDVFAAPLWRFKKRETTKDAKDTKTTDSKKQELNPEALFVRSNSRI
jgi:hypothetical protein